MENQKHIRTAITLFIFLAFLIFIYIHYQKNNFDNIHHKLVDNLTKAIQTSIFFIQNLSHNFFSQWELNKKEKTKSEELLKELNQAREEIIHYKGLVESLIAISSEKKRLEEILNYKNSIPYKTKVTKIIAKDPQNLFTTLIIDKGNKDNIEVGLPVVAFYKNQYALVGKILETTSSNAKVMTIFDQRFEVGVSFTNNESIAIMQGQAPNSFNVLIKYLDKTLTNIKNELIVTSSIGEKYPDNIPIGYIMSVENVYPNLFQTAQVKPIINVFNIKDLFVLTKEN